MLKMRQITEKTVMVFLSNENTTIKMSDTNVTCVDGKDKALYLHGSIIAMRNIKTGVVKLNNKGYTTNTTKERLNGILELLNRSEDKIYQTQGSWFWGNKKDKREYPYNTWVTLK